MVIVYVLGLVFAGSGIVSIVRYIQNKDYLNLIATVFLLVFSIFLFSTGILGGSAYNDAPLDYELYQDGHYYLVSHNHYTEVMYCTFVYMRVMEPVGIVSFAIFFMIVIYNKIKEKKGVSSHLLK